ncbi:hypothetical protein [uncultured Pseudoalteromonas sp.]|uniref:hypothetical protein n=1 Tax=uncultured Pseudoalteromonas sp. TaxID=114053 RepID=UPI00259A5D4B|nr:hypothetical protein [uncultured Pseudoalteromonas sp.]
MPAIKKSVRIVERAQTTLKAVMPGANENWSGAINALAGAFDTLLVENMPDLNGNECIAIDKALSKLTERDFKREAEMLDWYVRDNAKLVEKIKPWSLTQRMAVVYAVNLSKEIGNGK